ncbi:MAG: glycosyltransferase family 2 protein [Bacillota bacterium]|nr:glycosyltransferase family 2 protein [Bacillota bacterium]
MPARPLVSAVIPTRGRPQWIVRAVSSALAQSYAPVEVIVVIDGPDEITECAVREISAPRLRTISLRENVGGAEARNIGVRAASGEWIAFLDDDDEWFPEKLEKQMQAALSSGAEYPVVGSRLIAAGRVLPRRLYRRGQDVSEYLFCRKGLAYGDGMLQTSTLLAKRELLLEVPFQRGLKRHQDWDWLLKIAQRKDVEIVMLPDALTVMQIEGGQQSVSRSGDWRVSLEWARANRERMTAKAYSFFIATECVTRARKAGAGAAAFAELFRECFMRGRPGLGQTILFFLFRVFPGEKRRTLRGPCYGRAEERFQHDELHRAFSG